MKGMDRMQTGHGEDKLQVLTHQTIRALLPRISMSCLAYQWGVEEPVPLLGNFPPTASALPVGLLKLGRSTDMQAMTNSTIKAGCLQTYDCLLMAAAVASSILKL